MMNSLDLIESDFKLLSNEMKKRYTNIKDSVDRALKIISTSKGQDLSQILQQMDQLLQPLSMIFEQKAVKVFIPALNCLQKMAQLFSISDQGILQILTMLKDGSAENVDEMTQIKILQILLIFLNPNTIKLSKELVDLVLQCSFQMFYSKSNSVKSTIQATLRQLFTIVFAQFVQKCKLYGHNEEFFDIKKRLYISQDEKKEIVQRLKMVEQEPVFKITTDLLVNLSYSLSVQDSKNNQQLIQKNSWNLQPSMHSKCMMMDILCLSLTQTQDLLGFFPTVLKIFDSEVVPVVELMFKSKQIEYIIGMRLMKLSILIINNLGIGINLLNFVLQETDGFLTKNKDGSVNVNLTWKSLIGFECVAIVMNNPNLIKSFAQSALQVNKTVLVQLFESLIQATENLDLSGEMSQRHMMNPQYSQQKTPKFIEATILENELPPPTAAQIHKLIVEAICSYVENMIIIFDQYGLKIGVTTKLRYESITSAAAQNQMQNLQQKSPITKGEIDCKDLLSLSWRPLLMVLQNLLKVTNEESNMQMLLNSYQNFIGVCGSVHCFEARDGFLESLCSFCLSTEFSKVGPQGPMMAKLESASKTQNLGTVEYTLNEKNIQICKTLLNIAHCLGYILDVKSWYIILETMQRIETVIKTKIKTKGGARQNNPTQPLINQQTGNQTLVEFNEIKQRVQEKMKEYNLSYESNSIFSSASKQSSMDAYKEEEKKGRSENFTEDKREGIIQPEKSGLNAKRGSLQNTDPKHQRFGSLAKSSIEVGNSAAGSLQFSGTKQFESNNPSLMGSSQHPSSNLMATSSFDSIQASSHQHTDLQILQDSFDSLFTSSILFDQQSLAELITSLGQLTVGVLENISTKKSSSQGQIAGSQTGNDKNVRGASSKHQPNESEVLQNINTFAISRLVETALVNISRIELIWKILIAHFDILSNCKVQALRQLSLEALLCIILEIFSFRKEKKILDLRMPKESPSKINRNTTKSRKSITSSGNEEEDDMEIDVDENWSGTVWQYTILTPFSDQLKSQHQSNKFQTLKGIEKIIQACGQQLKNDGWRIVIITISKTPELDSEQVVATGFRCLKLIVSNYIDKLSQENFITILQAIHKYASNDGENINNNLTAVGMFQNIADFTAKLMLKDQPSQDGNVFNPQRIWSILFEKIQELGGDYRAEIRRANIFTLENILMTHGQLLTEQVWNAILRNNLLNMLRNSIEMYTQQKSGPSQAKNLNIEAGLPTPSFSSGGWETKKKGGKQTRKMNFDDDSVLKALQKNNDEQWEETCVLLVQTVLRSIKKYNQLDTKSNELMDFVWNNTVHIITDIIRNGSQEICSTVYKAIEDLLGQSNCVDLFMNNIGISFKILDATSEWLIQEKQDTSSIQRKPMNLKLCPVIIETLKKIYNLENLQENQFRAPYLQIIIPTYAQILFQLLYRMMKCHKNSSEGFQGMGVPHKLLTEEKVTFEFIDSLNDIVRKNDQTHLIYLKFLLQFTEYELQEPHSEAFIRRIFSILNSIILQGKVSNEILKEILPQLFDRIESLINLRYNNDACMGLVFPSKGSQTLFYTVGLYAMHFSSFLINPKHFKNRMQAHYKQIQEQQKGPNFLISAAVGSQTSSGGGTGGFSGGLMMRAKSSPLTPQEDYINTSSDIMFSEQLEFSIVDPAVISIQPLQSPEIKQIVWQRVLPLAKTHLLFNPEKVVNHNKAVVEDVVKSSQDLDMQVMNFITNSLLPNCSDINDKEFQQSLVAIIDNGCNSVYSSQRLSQGSGAFGNTQSTGPFGNSLSKYCLNNLFELCRFQPAQQMNIISGGGSAEYTAEDAAQEKRIYEIRRKIATITTPVLINRCRDTLKKYTSDEQKSGSMTLPRQRVSEAVFTLEKLRQLDCYPEVQPQQYKSKKGHLVQLMPIFADLVLSNENALKEHLRLIFLDISEAIANAQSLKGNEERKVGDSSGGEF